MSVVMMSYLFFTDNLPFMQAAGVGTGAADINAKYHDGYASSLSAGSGVIYVSDGSNYLPDSTVDAGAIVDGTITSDDMASSYIEPFSVYNSCNESSCSATASCGTGNRVLQGFVGASSRYIAQLDTYTECLSNSSRTSSYNGGTSVVSPNASGAYRQCAIAWCYPQVPDPE